MLHIELFRCFYQTNILFFRINGKRFTSHFHKIRYYTRISFALLSSPNFNHSKWFLTVFVSPLTFSLLIQWNPTVRSLFSLWVYNSYNILFFNLFIQIFFNAYFYFCNYLLPFYYFILLSLFCKKFSFAAYAHIHACTHAHSFFYCIFFYFHLFPLFITSSPSPFPSPHLFLLPFSPFFALFPFPFRSFIIFVLETIQIPSVMLELQKPGQSATTSEAPGIATRYDSANTTITRPLHESNS